MRVVVIGGTGHVGTYLTPRLVECGHEVISVSRGSRSPYHHRGEWDQVRQIQLDRKKADNAGTFAQKILDLEPDVVIDMICFTLESAKHLAEALQGRVQHFLHCGSIWVHGHSTEVPTTEDEPRRPFGQYGTRKAAIEAYLLKKAAVDSFPATVLHPGHIVGPGWTPINPAGTLDLAVFETLARGGELTLPNLGMETLHHVHADDVAQAFVNAMRYRSTAIGESFHVVSAKAITLRGYAEKVASWFGQEANLCFLPWNEWKTTVSEEDAQATSDHIHHSPNCSMEKARRLLDYQPRYSSMQAIREAVEWLVEQGEIKIVR